MNAPQSTVLIVLALIGFGSFVFGVVRELDRRYWWSRRIWKPWAVVLVRSPYGIVQRGQGITIKETRRVWTHDQAVALRDHLRREYPLAGVRIKKASRLR